MSMTGNIVVTGEFVSMAFSLGMSLRKTNRTIKETARRFDRLRRLGFAKAPAESRVFSEAIAIS
jgi:hypothetical protein